MTNMIMWKDIPGWENLYAVSSEGKVINKKTGAYIKGDINNAGYCRITLYKKGGKSKRFFRHRLVATLFVPNPNGYKEINHIDGNKFNNAATNLQWCTRSQNEREARRLGIKNYTPYVVEFFNGTTRFYEFVVDLAKELNISARTVLNYLQGKSTAYDKHGIKSIRYCDKSLTTSPLDVSHKLLMAETAGTLRGCDMVLPAQQCVEVYSRTAQM